MERSGRATPPRAGRLPASCVPRQCEDVLQVRSNQISLFQATNQFVNRRATPRRFFPRRLSDTLPVHGRPAAPTRRTAGEIRADSCAALARAGPRSRNPRVTAALSMPPAVQCALYYRGFGAVTETAFVRRAGV